MIDKKEKIDLSLIICCYNEEEILYDNFCRLIGYLDSLQLSYELIVIDDCSLDDTRDILAKLRSKFSEKKIKSFFHERNLGRGATVMHGIRESEGTVVGFIDIDLEVGEWYVLPCVMAIINDGYDVAYGSRVYKIKLNPYILIRHTLSLGYRKLRKYSLNIKSIDTESGYKFFNREIIIPIAAKTYSGHWFWDTEIILLAEQANLKIKEIPCLFTRNLEKTSTVKAFRDSLKYLRDIWEFKSRRGSK